MSFYRATLCWRDICCGPVFVCLFVCLSVRPSQVISSHVHCKCGNISETVQDRDVVTTDH